MLSIFGKMKRHQKLIGVLIVVMVGALVLASLRGGWLFTACTGGGSILAILLLQKTRKIAGGVLMAVMRVTSMVLAPLLRAYLDANEHVRDTIATQAALLVGQPLPEIFRESSGQAWVFFAICMIVLAVIEAVHKYPAAGTRTRSDSETNSRTYQQDLKSFCRNLAVDLNNIDNDTHWSSAYFEPLDAEVEVIKQGRPSRHLTDLLSAIRRNNTNRLFIVLGDPGSGKSVALRVMCERMLKEAEASGRIPLYVNLKEWIPKEPWSQKNPPRLAELQEFVLSNLKPRLGVFGSLFLDANYWRMLQSGELFVVFDSFDEIPAVLDVDDSSWLVEALSAVFEHFFSGGTETRGIIASRYFRRPRLVRQQNVCTLEIRPFSDRKIAESFRRHSQLPDDVIATLLRDRHDLVPLARNPFTAGLITDYLLQSNNKLPEKKSEIYQSYIKNRLNAASDTLREENLTNDQVIACAIAIAGHMFNSKDVGLEIGIPALERALPEFQVPAVVEVLVAARIGRRSGSTKGRFSFVHRRFNEYFFVQYLLREEGVIDLSAIPTDSKWRDALVLYSEVCSDQIAKAIATYCWNEILRTSLSLEDDPRNYVRHVHCLRFLGDAFHGRTGPLVEFQTGLFQHILTAVTNGRDILTKVIAVEASGLLRSNHLRIVVIKALNLNVPWISETAFNACRYIPELPRAIRYRLIRFLGQYNVINVISRYKELRFALRLSPAMAPLRGYWLLRGIDVCTLIFAICVLSILRPLPAIFTAALFAAVLAWAYSERALASTEQSGEAPVRATAKEFKSRKQIGLVFTYINIVLGTSFFSYLQFPLNVKLISFFQYENAAMEFVQAYCGRRLTALITLLLLPVFIFPLHRVVNLVPYFTRNSREQHLLLARLARFLSKGWGKRLMYLVTIILLIGCISFLVALTDHYKITSWVWGGLLGLLAIALVTKAFWLAIRYGRNWIADRQIIAKLNSTLPKTRQDIEDVLTSLRLSVSRVRYLAEIQAEGVKPQENWSRGNVPQFGNVDVDTLLAKLEARWLGVDR